MLMTPLARSPKVRGPEAGRVRSRRRDRDHAATVRAALLPAAMKLLGDWNWYLPKWLEWLPQVSHETEAAPRPMPAPHPSVPEKRRKSS